MTPTNVDDELSGSCSSSTLVNPTLCQSGDPVGWRQQTIQLACTEIEKCCQLLKLGPVVKDTAVRQLRTVWQQYTLEGAPSRWVVCAIYTSYYLGTCSETDLSGLTLIDILKACRTNLLEFFDRIERWVGMVPNNRRVPERVKSLESTFGVAAALFKKFTAISNDIFVENSEEPNTDGLEEKEPSPEEQSPPARSTRGRKRRKESSPPPQDLQTVEPVAKPNKRKKLTKKNYLHFTWKFYIYIKSLQKIGDDLVGCFHLLLSCVDQVVVDLYKNGDPLLISEEYRTILSGSASEAYSILSLLCANYTADLVEVKRIRSYMLRPRLRTLLDDGLLHSGANTNSDNIDGLILPGNLEKNVELMDEKYQQYLVASGMVDESIFLSAEECLARIGSPDVHTSKLGSDAEFVLNKSVQACLERVSRHPPPTPLSGKQYLSTMASRAVESFSPVTPVTHATQALEQLLTMLADCDYEPSTELEAIFRNCSGDLRSEIYDRIHLMSVEFEGFCKKNLENLDGGSSSLEDFVRQRTNLVRILYFRTLTKILRQEIQRQPTVNIVAIVRQDVLHRSIYACCLEIVMFSYNSQWTFPCILDIFSLAAFNFYKVIELIIRAEQGLCRDVVKHLSSVEEKIIEELAWVSESPLWGALEVYGGVPPAYEEVAPPRSSNKETISATAIQLPLRKNVPQTPLGLAGRFPASPSTTSSIGFGTSASKRKLTFDSSHLVIELPSAKKSNLQPLVVSLPSKHVASVDGNVQNEAKTAADQKFVSSGASGMDSSETNPSSSSEGPISLPVTTGNSSAGGSSGGDISKGAGSVEPVTLPFEMEQNDEGGSRQRFENKQNNGAGNDAAGRKLCPPISAPKIGSLALFFRKVYCLAHVRLRDLSERLNFDEHLQQQSWTFLEKIVRRAPELFRDRHLDQLIICSVYIMAKVTTHPRSFQDILYAYRHQPQCKSRVYRNVLLERKPAAVVCGGVPPVSSHPVQPGASNAICAPSTSSSGPPLLPPVSESLSASSSSVIPQSSPALSDKVGSNFGGQNHSQNLSRDPVFPAEDSNASHDDALSDCTGVSSSSLTLPCSAGPGSDDSNSSNPGLPPGSAAATFPALPSPVGAAAVADGAGVSVESSSGSGRDVVLAGSAVAIPASSANGIGVGNGGKLRSASAMPVPAVSSAPPTPTPVEEERGDLIRFYNQVFVRKVENHAREFAPYSTEDGPEGIASNLRDEVPLSPFPQSSRTSTLTPRKRVANGVFLSPMKPSGASPVALSARPLQYSFCRSPYKDLAAINTMIRENAAKRTKSGEKGAMSQTASGGGSSGDYRRRLQFDDEMTTRVIGP